jgi:hypothetical protein
MQFLNPAGFFLLGLIPVLLFIHSLKPRPKTIQLANLYLWQEVLRDRAGGFRIQKILVNLPLLLQILAVILGALALSNPVWTYKTVEKGNVILILDTSASMKTEKEGTTRFDLGREKALEVIDQLPVDSRMMILEAAPSPVLRAAFSNDKPRLKEVIREMKPSDLAGRIDKALFLGLSFARPEKEDRVVLITDGAAAAVRDLITANPRIEPVILTPGERNIGITRFEIREAYTDEAQTQFFLEVKNFNPYTVLCPVRITHKGAVIVEETIGLRPWEKKGLIFPNQGLLSGVAQAQLLVKDDFSLDNEAAMAIETSQDVRVLVVGQENFFLLRLLKSFPNLIVNTVSDIAASSWGPQVGNHDILILNNVSPPSTEIGNFILLNAFSPSLPLTPDGSLTEVKGLDWDAKSPLLKGLSFQGLNVARATRIRSETTIKPLLQSNDSGLIYAYEREGLKVVLFGFDLNRSDLPLRVAFPVLFRNIFKWFLPDRFSLVSLKTETGSPFTLYLRQDGQNLRIGRPDGKWEEYRSVISPFQYTATDEVGVYTFIENDDWRHFAVNLVNESESDIRVPDTLLKQLSERSALKAKIVEGLSYLWLMVVVLLLAALYVEWFLWMKRR